MNKIKDVKIVIVIIIIVLCLIFSKNIRYFITGNKDVIISEPTAIDFSIIGEDKSDLYPIIESDETTYVTIDKKYFNNDDVKIYVTGTYWNSPEKPLVKFNGKVIDNVESDNTGYAENVFSDNYYSKNYHFTINETIEEDKEYTVYVRIKDISTSTKIIFTTKETSEGELLSEENLLETEK